MIDRDSYPPDTSGYDAFLSDARALLEIVHSYATHDVALERTVAAADLQRLLDAARRSIAATAVDELGALADLMADVAREFGAAIEADLRAAKRLIDLTYAETCDAPLPTLSPVETTLFDPADLPEFTQGRHTHN